MFQKGRIRRENKLKSMDGREKRPWRAIILGVILNYLVGIGIPVLAIQMPNDLGYHFLTPTAIFGLVVLIFTLNLLLKFLNKRWSLSSGELIIIYVMMTVACALPIVFVQYCLSITTGAYYYATPENKWAEIIQPYIPKWLVPQNQEAITRFYEGLAPGQSIPWKVWFKPMLAWGSFWAVLCFVMVCMMVIIRKQWVEKERLLFPLVQLPLEMVKEDPAGGRLSPFFKNRLMWLGFMIPFLFGTINSLHVYFPFIPSLSNGSAISTFRNSTCIKFTISFAIMGLAYLLSLDVAFSLWFFHLVCKVQSGICNMIGYTLPGQLEPFFGDSEAIGYQSLGAMICLVAFSMWIARRHLKDVVRKAFKGDKNIDDSKEIISYRVAVCGMIGGLIFMWFWLWKTGLNFWVAFMFLILGFAVFLGLTRIVSQGGIGFARPVGVPQPFLIYTLGSSFLGPAGLSSLALSYSWIAESRSLVSVYAINAMKMADGIIRNKQPIFWALIIAIVVGLFASIYQNVVIGYRYGALNIGGWLYIGCSKFAWESMADKLRHPINFSSGRFAFFGIGSAFMASLMFMQHRFLWWPVHYLGFPIANSEPMEYAWFNIFVVWLVKAMVLKYGGGKVYWKLRPFFLGMVLGQVVTVFIWGLVSIIVPHGQAAFRIMTS